MGRETRFHLELEAGIDSATSVVSFVEPIDSCASIVAELARGYEWKTSRENRPPARSLIVVKAR